MPQRSVMVTPPAKSAATSTEFSVDIVVYPYIAGRDASYLSQLINNYQVAVGYNPNELSFVRAETLLPDFRLTSSESLGTIYLDGVARDIFKHYFTFQPTPLAKLFFAPKKEGSSQITVADFTAENTFGPEGRTATLVDQYQLSTITAQAGGACTPNCAGKTCGTDGCGGFCGSLNGACAGAQEVCQNNQCACVPECNLRECGDNGCGGTCGTCTAGLSCNGVQCVASQQASTLIYTPPQNTPSAPRQVAAPSRPATSPRTPAQPSAPSGADEGLHLYGPSQGIGAGGGVPSVPVEIPAPIPAPITPPVVPPTLELPSSEPQAVPAAPPVTSSPPASLPVEKKFPWWIIILIVAVLILGGLGYYYYRQKKEREAHAYYGQYMQPSAGTGVPPPQSPQPSQPPRSPSPPFPPQQVPPRQPPF